MSRVKRGVSAHKRHKKIIKMASGYRGRGKNCYRIAVQRVEKALQYAYRDRRCRKRDIRRLWTQRINAAARIAGITYSHFIHRLNLHRIAIDRKMLAELAVNDQAAFNYLVCQVREAQESSPQ